ncbi:MAG: acyltransferase family protein [Cohaesibacteraceae bacterium]|nr:acyltransferase family protein [Cohaesibacteraceae bacterium]PCH80273.1 MAG: acyltransferase [Hyphomicrobiales bacterium]
MAKAVQRVDWIDLTKGVTIILVVMMHSVLGVEKAVGYDGWMHVIVEFARPFRIPLFFLVAGLFLHRSINSNWRIFLDRKVLNFFYFYVLWVTIQFAFKGLNFIQIYGVEGAIQQYLLTFIEPFGTLWFIYVLPLFYIATKLLRRAPAVLVLVSAATLHIAGGVALQGEAYQDGTLIKEFADRFFFFLVGYYASSFVFNFAKSARETPVSAIVGFAAWALTNGWIVWMGYAQIPLMSLLLGIAGSFSVIALISVMSSLKITGFLRYCGERSLIIYLAFFLPMVVTRIVLIKIAPGLDAGTMSFIVMSVAVISPLVLKMIIDKLKIGKFLFVRPRFVSLDRRKSPRTEQDETRKLPAE